LSKIQPVGHRLPYQGFPIETTESNAEAEKKDTKQTFKPLYKLDASIPKDFRDPRTFVLLNVLHGFSPKVLSAGPCAAIVNYYWDSIRRRFQISNGFNFAQGIVLITYT